MARSGRGRQAYHDELDLTGKLTGECYFDRLGRLYFEWPIPVVGDILGYRLASVDTIISRRVFFESPFGPGLVLVNMKLKQQ